MLLSQHFLYELKWLRGVLETWLCVHGEGAMAVTGAPARSFLNGPQIWFGNFRPHLITRFWSNVKDINTNLSNHHCIDRGFLDRYLACEAILHGDFRQVLRVEHSSHGLHWLDSDNLILLSSRRQRFGELARARRQIEDTSVLLPAHPQVLQQCFYDIGGVRRPVQVVCRPFIEAWLYLRIQRHGEVRGRLLQVAAGEVVRIQKGRCQGNLSANTGPTRKNVLLRKPKAEELSCVFQVSSLIARIFAFWGWRARLHEWFDPSQSSCSVAGCSCKMGGFVDPLPPWGQLEVHEFVRRCSWQAMNTLSARPAMG